MAAKTLRERAAELGIKAMAKLFEDPKRAEAIAAAIGGLQRAKQALDDAQEKALRAAGLPTRDDFKEAGKRISARERRMRVRRLGPMRGSRTAGPATAARRCCSIWRARSPPPGWRPRSAWTGYRRRARSRRRRRSRT